MNITLHSIHMACAIPPTLQEVRMIMMTVLCRAWVVGLEQGACDWMSLAIVAMAFVAILAR